MFTVESRREVSPSDPQTPILTQFRRFIRAIIICAATACGDDETPATEATATAETTSTDDNQIPTNGSGPLSDSFITSTTEDNNTTSLLETSGSSGSTDATSATTFNSPPFCGDMKVEGDEECDDGNQAPHDGCTDCLTDEICILSPEHEPMSNECFDCIGFVPECCDFYTNCVEHVEPFYEGDECIKKFDCEKEACTNDIGTEGWDLYGELHECLQADAPDCLERCEPLPQPKIVTKVILKIKG